MNTKDLIPKSKKLRTALMNKLRATKNPSRKETAQIAALMIASIDDDIEQVKTFPESDLTRGLIQRYEAMKVKYVRFLEKYSGNPE
jgi:hypothetical protein